MMGCFRDQCLGTASDSSGRRCLIIGEVAQTHDGSLGQAHAFIDAIANAGADAVKFQTHIAAAESTPGEPWRVKFSRQDATRYEYWERMEFTRPQWAGLKEHAESLGLLFISSPFSMEAFEMLNDLDMKVWKIASGEIGNSQMVNAAAATGKPVILSSGMSDYRELDSAVEIVKGQASPLAVVQCTSAYPCPPEKTGLNVMAELRSRYECASGLSDHSGKIYAGLAAAALGAEVIEVHVTLSREMFGPDVPSSITTAELSQLVEGVRSIETMLSNPVHKDAVADELEPLRKIFTKSFYAASELSAGTVLKEDHLLLKKPGVGINADELPRLLGRRLVNSLDRDQLIRFDDIEVG